MADREKTSEKAPGMPPYLQVIPDNIPAELKELDQWVIWKAALRGDKWTKAPYTASGKMAKANDPATWTTFDRAFGAYRDAASDGIGFVFAKGGGITGVDLDHCIGEDGALVPQAVSILRILGSYSEYSVSGKGLHVIVKASLKSGKRTGPIEIYPHGRYFTMTGHVYGEPKGIAENQARTEQLARLISKPEKPARSSQGFASRRPYLNNDALIEKAKAAKNGAKFTSLWEGDASGYPSHSEADAALLAELLYWTNGDEDRTDVLFRQSGMCTEKWLNRADYRRRSFRFLRGCNRDG
jgi:primase-polymerase (primpol)-like protein